MNLNPPKAPWPSPGERWLLWLVLAVAAALRLYRYASWSLSNDELSALSRLRFDGLPALIEGGVKPDMHPAGVQLFLYAWTHLAGLSPWALRLPFVLAGIASVFLLYRIGTILFNRHAGLAAAATLAVLEYPVQYSQLARPYGFGLLFVLAAAFFWVRICFPERTRDPSRPGMAVYAGFVMSVVACMVTHYFAMFQAGLICLSGLLFVRGRILRYYLLCGAAILVLYLPNAGILMHHLATGGLGGEGGWLGPPDASFFGKYLGYAFNGKGMLLAVAAAFCVLSAIRAVRRKDGVAALALAWFLVPLFTGYVYSVTVNPVLQYSVLLFAFPFLLLYLYSFLPGVRTPLYPVPFTAFLLAAGTWSTVFANRYYTTEHFAVFGPLAGQAAAWDDRFGAENITRVANVHSPYYLDYYFERMGRTVPFAMYRCNTYDAMGPLVRVVNGSRTPCFLYAWSNILDLPETEAVIRTRYPFVAGKSMHFNSGIVLYSRDSTWYRPEDILFDTTIAPFPAVNGNAEPLADRSGPFRMDPDMAFSPGIESRTLVVDAPFTAIASVSFRGASSAQANIVFSIDRDDGTAVWIGRQLGDFLPDGDSAATAHAVYRGSEPLSGHETVKAYVWNDKKKTVYLTSLRLLIVRN